MFKKILFFLLMLGLAGCAGYTTKPQLPYDIKTIYVPTAKNKIPLESMYIYVPGMEADITNAVISRFNLDGTLKVVSRREDADAVLNIDLINFDQQGTRFTQLESVEEYRLFVTTNVQLKDNRTDQVLLDERNVTGKTSYFVQTSRSDTMYKARKRESISEPLRNAAVRAIEDYAHNVVDLVTEAW